MTTKQPSTILVVEDEMSFQRLLTQKLESEGFVVINATDGEDGLALALKNHPDLILLDWQMPTMTGLEMAKNLRQDAWGESAKIIFLTNLSDIENVQQAMENQVFEYLVKSDVSLDKVVEKIKEFLAI